jgi:hypothetical protein
MGGWLRRLALGSLLEDPLGFFHSRLWVADGFLPARLMKYWIIRMPEPIPFGLTFLLAMVRATVSASWLNVSRWGNSGT